MGIRAARAKDVPRLTEIYNHAVMHSPATFDLEPKTVEERRAWFAQFAETGRYRLLVAEDDGVVLGYAGTTRWRPKAAYDRTVETTIYCAAEAVGRGVGTRLYAAVRSAGRGRCASVCGGVRAAECGVGAAACAVWVPRGGDVSRGGVQVWAVLGCVLAGAGGVMRVRGAADRVRGTNARLGHWLAGGRSSRTEKPDQLFAAREMH